MTLNNKIINNMQQKTDEELIKIVKDADTKLYTKEALQIAKAECEARGLEVAYGEDVNNSKQVIVVQGKSAGVAFLLTFFFGPLGMLYSTVSGALIMFFVSILIGIATLGMGLILTQIICIIWAVGAVDSSNKKLIT